MMPSSVKDIIAVARERYRDLADARIAFGENPPRRLSSDVLLRLLAEPHPTHIPLGIIRLAQRCALWRNAYKDVADAHEARDAAARERRLKAADAAQRNNSIETVAAERTGDE